MNKIAIGTVQFGLDYGISNKNGKISHSEILNILDFAHLQGINIIDTAHAYGDSEKILGELIQKDQNFKVVTKLSAKATKVNVEREFEQSLARLGMPSVYGYMLHDFNAFKNDDSIWTEFIKIKASKRTEKIGFSLYSPEELVSLFDRKIDFDIIQLPYNIFDRRFEPYFQELKKRNIEIHIRSVFLQGLVFLSPETLPQKLKGFSSRLDLLRQLSVEHNIPVEGICMLFVYENEYINNLVLGVESLQNLKNNIDSLKYIERFTQLISKLGALQTDDLNLIIPSNWN